MTKLMHPIEDNKPVVLKPSASRRGHPCTGVVRAASLIFAKAATYAAIALVLIATATSSAAQDSGARPQSSQPANVEPPQPQQGLSTPQEQQGQPAPIPAQVRQKLAISVYPNANQSAERQQRDESECYLWAKEHTGIDPEAQDQKSEAGKAKGAAGGAAVGAVAGPVAGAAARHRQKKEAQQQEQTQEQAMTTFKNAITACLQGRNYSVR